MINYPQMDKFSWKELFNNSKGQTDVHFFCGFIMVIVSCITFPWSVFEKLETYANLSIAFATLGSALLGISRFTKDKDIVILGEDKQTTDTPQIVDDANK